MTLLSAVLAIGAIVGVLSVLSSTEYSALVEIYNKIGSKSVHCGPLFFYFFHLNFFFFFPADCPSSQCDKFGSSNDCPPMDPYVKCVGSSIVSLYASTRVLIFRSCGILPRRRVLPVTPNSPSGKFLSTRIGQLSSLKNLTITTMMTSTLPSQIGNLRALESLCDSSSIVCFCLLLVGTCMHCNVDLSLWLALFPRTSRWRGRSRQCECARCGFFFSFFFFFFFDFDLQINSQLFISKLDGDLNSLMSLTNLKDMCVATTKTERHSLVCRCVVEESSWPHCRARSLRRSIA